MSLPTLHAALSTLHDRLGPLPYQFYDALPDELTERQASLLLLAEQPAGGLAIFRLSDGQAEQGPAVEAVLRDTAMSLCPGLVRGFEIVALQGGACAIVWLAPMPSLDRWAGPADLRPVLGSGVDDFEEYLLDHAPEDAVAEEVEATPDLWDEHERALVSLGALFPWRGELLATVSGLLTYGDDAHEHLPGQRLVTRNGRYTDVRMGDIGTLCEHGREVLHSNGGIPRRLGTALLLNAFALRSWNQDDPGGPVGIEADEGTISVAAPGTTLADWRAREERRPNAHLDVLLRRLGIWKGPMLDLRTIQQELRRVGLPVLSVEEEADKVVFGLRASVDVVAAARTLDVWTEEGAGLVSSAVTEDRVAKPAIALKVLPANIQAEPRISPPLTQDRRPVGNGLAMPSLRPVTADARPTVSAAARSGRGAGRAVRARRGARLSAEARATQLLDLLQTEPAPLTRHEIEHTLSWSRSTTRAVLAGLVADGRVGLEAASPRSPHQRYRAA